MSEELTMLFVVNKSFSDSKESLFEAVCKTSALVHLEPLNHNALYSWWNNQAFAKVVLKVKTQKQWQEVHTLPGATLNGVRCLSPLAKSTRPAFLNKLQTLQSLPDLAESTPLVCEKSLKVWTSPHLEMSLGKNAAQTSHAVLLWIKKNCPEFLFESGDKEALEQIFSSICFEVPSAKAWEEQKKKDNVVVIKDAGRTEIAPGSETVLAFKE